MRQLLLKRLKNEEKGFTLIELLAVIVILGVIAAIAVPLIGNIISKSKSDANIATARQIYDATRLYITAEKGSEFANSTTPVAVTIVGGTGDTLQSKGYLDKNISLPSTKKVITGGTVQFRANGDLQYVSITTSDGTIYYSGADVLDGEGAVATATPT